MDDHDPEERARRAGERLLDVLVAVDLKRLVRAAQEDDDAVVAEIRQRYGAE